MSVTIHTSVGDLKFEVFCDTAPRTCFNFLSLLASGKYNKTVFHRNIKGFMIQGGDTAHVTGKKSSIWGDEVTFPDEFHPNNMHDKRGQLSMANRGPNTNKSQFFILYEQQPHLNNLHTVFGRLLDGWDVLDKMERMPCDGSKPLEPPVILGATIHANPLADEGITYPTPDGPPKKS